MTTTSIADEPIRAWCFGCNSDPDAVIDALRDAGGKNPYEMDGKGDENIYFIDNDGNICMYGPKAKMERDLLTTHPSYCELHPDVKQKKFAVKVTNGVKSVTGVLHLHPIYADLFNSLTTEAGLNISIIPFDNIGQTCWMDIESAPLSQKVLCKMDDGTIVSGIIMRTVGGMCLFADDAVEVIANTPKYWMPIPE